MSSVSKAILDRLADEALEGAEKLTPERVGRALEHAKELAQGLGGYEGFAAEQGLALLERHRALLADMTQGAAVVAVARLGLGEHKLARLVYLATSSTLEERLAASEESTAATREAAMRREAAWDAFVKDAGKVGMAALRAVLPLLLAAL